MNDIYVFLILLLLAVVLVLVSLLLFNAKQRQRLNAQELLTALQLQTESLRQIHLSDLSRTRGEISQEIKLLESELLSKQIEITKLQAQQSDRLNLSVETMLRSSQTGLEKLKEENRLQLTEMRQLVEEKLHQTLETRLTESFQVVSNQLKTVHTGLGEMKTLARGISDLNKIMSNVKTRGIWGEVQLESILREMLLPQQYEVNVATRPGSSERVEFALKLPGKKGEQPIWLPIDAKFPQEDYLRLIEAENTGDKAAAQEAGLQLEKRIKQEARTIMNKYIEPPFTTDFAFMFVPTESLYAEIGRRGDLLGQIQREHRVTIVGPNTLATTLNALAVGFRTLAIEQRADEVWRLLTKVKVEFGRFSDLLEKTHKKLQEASNTVEIAARKSRTIEKSLTGVTLETNEAKNSFEDSETT